MGKLGDDYIPPADIVVGDMPCSCQWILSVLNKAISETVSSLDLYEFSDAATAVYSWWQSKLCDVFIEVIKPYFSSNASEYTAERKFAQDTLWVCLDNGLRLLHPFMPFVTEELWQRLPARSGYARKASIVISEYPSIVAVRN
jgi:valyl-tRNA synthetase